MTEHTPTPWELFNSNGTIAIRNPRSRSSHNEIVFWTGFDASHYPKQAEANAAFIVKAVNSHEALIAALKKIADTDQYPDHEDTSAELREIARSAIFASPREQPLRGRDSIRKILTDHFRTGEPGELDAIEAATNVLASPEETDNGR